MGSPYMGEIRVFGGNFAPRGWHLCDGSLLPISEHEALFVLIGTTYGGDGVETFALPDFRGRTPVHFGSNAGSTYVMGQAGGQENRTLGVANLPRHSHQIQVSGIAGTTTQPSGSVIPAATSAVALYNDEGQNPVTMDPASVGPAGNSVPFSLMMPFETTNFIIALEGIFPTHS